MDSIFYAENTVFEPFVEDLLSMSINLLLSLCLVSPGTYSTWVLLTKSVGVWKPSELTGT